MNYAEPSLIENAETDLICEPTSKSDALENTCAYDAAFMVGRDLPPAFIDDSSSRSFPPTTEDMAKDSEVSLIKNSFSLDALDPLEDVEQLTINQASKILGITEDRVKILIKNDTLCCTNTDANNEPRLSAACVRAQAGKSKIDFVQEVKRLIAGENGKRRKRSVDLPDNADACLQDLFDDAQSTDNFVQLPEYPQSLKVQMPATDASSSSHRDEKNSSTIVQPSSASREVRVRGINREEITGKNLEAVLENLDFSSVRLEGAMYRIGYLEAKLDDLQKELQIMPELRTKWAKSLILERENEEYKATIAGREHELLELHQLLDKLKDSWWCRSWCWLTGIVLK